jgi:integrase/recombinase XerD
MLSIYRRHGLNCNQTSRRYRRCNCLCWVEGTLEGKYLRQSLKVRSWERAEKIIREMEESGDEKRAKRITLVQACDSFIQDAQSRRLQEATIYKYRLLFQRLKEWAVNEGIRFLSELNLQALQNFRATWEYQNFAARNQTERLRALFRFAHDGGWLKENPARNLKSPRVRDVPTEPFSQEEFRKIILACNRYTGKNASLLKAFVLLLRYSGLRIRDAVKLERKQISDGKLFLYTAKTGTPVRIPLPPECLESLASLPSNGSYYFWSGNGKPKGRVGNFQGMLRTLFKLAEVNDGHPHRFRHTFACELLLAGVPIETVAILLGHSSVRVTEKHYSPWIARRQEGLEDHVRKTWASAVIRTKTRTNKTAIAKSQ